MAEHRQEVQNVCYFCFPLEVPGENLLPCHFYLLVSPAFLSPGPFCHLQSQHQGIFRSVSLLPLRLSPHLPCLWPSSPSLSKDLVITLGPPEQSLESRIVSRSSVKSHLQKPLCQLSNISTISRDEDMDIFGGHFSTCHTPKPFLSLLSQWELLQPLSQWCRKLLSQLPLLSLIHYTESPPGLKYQTISLTCGV